MTHVSPMLYLVATDWGWGEETKKVMNYQSSVCFCNVLICTSCHRNNNSSWWISLAISRTMHYGFLSQIQYVTAANRLYTAWQRHLCTWLHLRRKWCWLSSLALSLQTSTLHQLLFHGCIVLLTNFNWSGSVSILHRIFDTSCILFPFKSDFYMDFILPMFDVFISYRLILHDNYDYLWLFAFVHILLFSCDYNVFILLSCNLHRNRRLELYVLICEN